MPRWFSSTIMLLPLFVLSYSRSLLPAGHNERLVRFRRRLAGAGHDPFVALLFLRVIAIAICYGPRAIWKH